MANGALISRNDMFCHLELKKTVVIASRLGLSIHFHGRRKGSWDPPLHENIYIYMELTINGEGETSLLVVQTLLKCMCFSKPIFTHVCESNPNETHWVTKKQKDIKIKGNSWEEEGG